MKGLEEYIRELEGIFEQKDRRKAHRETEAILEEMAKNRKILFEAIKRNLIKPGYFSQARINPVLAFPIIENSNFSMVAHAFMPLPDRNLNLTHQSIHHHGNLLLSTINVFGEGYESILFKPGYQINQHTAQLEVDKHYVNKLYNYEFIGANTPHVVYYPSEICITFALWSTDKKIAADGLKKIGFLKKYKNQLRNGLIKLGLEKALNLNRIEYVDFYVEGGEVIPMKERIRYPEATNESLIANTFYLLQEIGFDDKAFIAELQQNLPKDEQSKVAPIAERFLNGESLTDSLDQNQQGIPKVNLSRKELELAFPNHK